MTEGKYGNEIHAIILSSYDFQVIINIQSIFEEDDTSVVFYSLPSLSPAFPPANQVTVCHLQCILMDP